MISDKEVMVLQTIKDNLLIWNLENYLKKEI
jgi:hypothetical protein